MNPSFMKKVIISLITLSFLGIGVFVFLSKTKTPDSQALVIEKLLVQSYDSLYNSRTLFDTEIKKLNSESKDMNFLWHPDYEKNQYLSSVKKSTSGEKIKETIINEGNYKITISSPDYLQDGFSLDSDDFNTHIVITKNGKSIDVKDYKKVNLSHIYKIQVDEVSYYLLGLCRGGMRGCGILIPIVYTNNELRVGEIIEDVDFSDWLRINDFFTKNSELYLVLDDSRYFWSTDSASGLSLSNNANFNSAVPRVFKFDKETANLILSINDFGYLYKIATEKIEKDLYSLKDSIPSEIRPLVMNRLIGKSLAPYFYYYLGMSIITSKENYSEVRNRIVKLYTEFYGKETASKANFEGYKDFEKN